MHKPALFSALMILFALCLGTGHFDINDVYAVPKEKLSYEAAWKEVAAFHDKGLPKSSLEVVDRIFAQAKQENNQPQLIKSLIHKIRYLQEVEEESLVKIQKLLQAELKGQSFPVRQILHSMVAEQYWNYYQRNRYRFLNRTATAKFKQNDMRTWSLGKIVEEVVRHYRLSLADPEKLKKEKIDRFSDILHNHPGGRTYRPTLFDFLAHRAIDFFANAEAGLAAPAYQFTLNKTAYFLPYAKFVEIPIKTRDRLSFQYHAITYLQELVRFHGDDESPEALIDADLKRLGFVHAHAVLGDKDGLYQTALDQLFRRYRHHPASTDIQYDLAKLFLSLGNQYKPGGNEQYRWYKKKASDLCAAAMAKFPDTPGAVNCNHLKTGIAERYINLRLEKTAIPRKPFRALVSYRNTNRLYYKIVRTDIGEIRITRNRSYDELLDHYNAKSAIAGGETALPDDGDFQTHAAEIKIDGLKPGKYMIIASNSPKFDRTTHAIAHAAIDVSNIAFIHRNVDRHIEYRVFHRDTGAPLADVDVQLWYTEWSRWKKQYVYEKGKSYQTDKNGFFQVRKGDCSSYFELEFIQGIDRFYPEQNFSLWHYYRQNREEQRTFFFTDRAIYRPGQVVHFKGILLNVHYQNGENSRIIPDRSVAVSLYDVNHQKVKTLMLKSNDYGTFSGDFAIPTGLLNGNFYLSDGYGYHYFSVEEYKRPNFEVSFTPLTKMYRLNDTIEAKGNARAYAGFAVDNARVKYRIVRQAFYPYRWYFWDYMPSAPQMEIVNGSTTTDAKGSFTVRFKAIPDLSLDRNSRPAFTYTIYADVTDINGETRRSQRSVSIGYTALQLHIQSPEAIDREIKKYTLAFDSTNLSGEFQAVKGDIRIYRLAAPDRIFRNRLWERPDRFVMDRKAYYKQFPNDYYDTEFKVSSWKREKTAFETSFNTADKKDCAINGLNSWRSGVYLIEMTARDAFGNEVKDIKFITLYSSRDKKPPVKTLDWCVAPKTTVEPGDTALVLIGSSEKNVTVLYEIEHRGSVIEKKLLRLDNEQKRIEIPIEEKHRGNVGVLLTFIRHNRVIRHTQTIRVPWSNKDLKLSFETFRNKLLPGEKDQWRIRIAGAHREKVAAEMAATLFDASLDAFRYHSWGLGIFPSHYIQRSWNDNSSFAAINSSLRGKVADYAAMAYRYYDQLNWFGFYWQDHYYRSRRYKRATGGMKMAMEKEKSADMAPSKDKRDQPSSPKTEEKAKKKNGGSPDQQSVKEDAARKDGISDIKARANFNETAFFYPHLMSDENGEILITFTVPESLTRWRMLGFAHTKSLAFGFTSNELITQKDLMVIPNHPRFFREGDSMVLTAKISNVAAKKLDGIARLALFDAATGKPIDVRFDNTDGDQEFSAGKGGSALVSWKVRIPDNLDAVSCRVSAKSGSFTDGEERPIPILKNRMLVTETMPLPIRSKQTKNFEFKKLLQSKKSSTLRHHKLTLEFTSNPAWYAVQALPYIMEYPYECLEQTFSRYYANSIATHIVNKNAKIKGIFEQWAKEKNSNALLSNLEKNQELKYLMLEETPWVLQAHSESDRKKRIALLFDLARMSGELDRALKKLADGQLSSGGWPWFKGMRESRYITQHIVTGLAHLCSLKVIDIDKNAIIKRMIENAAGYLDRAIRDDYSYLLRYKIRLDQNNLGGMQIQYLYARSYFQEFSIDSDCKTAFEYFKKQAGEYWLNFNYYMQGMIALGLHRYKDADTAQAIVKSIKEHALHSEEMGMYWKQDSGYYWYQAPIETQALLIEVFSELTRDNRSIDDMKTWLLKQKQTQDWRTTKATADACYALLLAGDNWLEYDRLAEITLGPVRIDPATMPNVKTEAGTGYFKVSWQGNEIKPDMGKVTVINHNPVVAWGGLYWQYFENLDKITPHKTPLSIRKKLFVERQSATGPVLFPIDKEKLRIGDRIKVRIELRVDRMMEFVHMKDMRASSLEPENVISRYKWQDGLGYYESTKDGSTNFFFDYLPKGTYVFEYPLRITHQGNFSNGITTIQCMYAPEFASHSEGVRINIK